MGEADVGRGVAPRRCLQESTIYRFRVRVRIRVRITVTFRVRVSVRATAE